MRNNGIVFWVDDKILLEKKQKTYRKTVFYLNISVSFVKKYIL